MDKQTKYWHDKTLAQIESYWTSPPANKRSKWFAEFLQPYAINCETIMEVGFFSGRNLHWIQEAYDHLTILGIDINPLAVEYAKAKLDCASLYHWDLHNIDNLPFHTDIVFTSGVMIHVPPEAIHKTMVNLATKAKKYIMCLEETGNGELTAGPKHLNPTYKVSDQKQWAHNLNEVMADSNNFQYTKVDLPPEIQTNGAKTLEIWSKA